MAQGNGDNGGEIVGPDDQAYQGQVQAKFYFHHSVQDSQSEHRQHSCCELSQTET
jgi:hypothetical protein